MTKARQVSHVHVVGAGLAGLAAAMSLVAAGIKVTLHEAGKQAGGRCRSYYDPVLGCRLDNGNHLLLSGNHATFAYLDQVGSRDTLTGPGIAVFPFVDIADGARWTVRPNAGPIPWWMLMPGRRVPGMRLADAFGAMRLHRARREQVVSDVLRPGVLYRRLLEPLAIAALNTSPDEGSARLLGAIVQETLAAGGGACIPWFPEHGLSESFVDPAVAWLEEHGAILRLGSRIARLAVNGGQAIALDGTPLGETDAVILAVPAPVAGGLMPDLVVPDRFEAILNVHFRCQAAFGEAGFVGVVGGAAEWIFVKPGVVSTTISAGNKGIDTPPDALAQQVWSDVCFALQLEQPIPPYRVVKEKRATFAATPEQEARRPGIRTAVSNVCLAGDWTATGLPATIEGAIRSGRAAAAAFI